MAAIYRTLTMLHFCVSSHTFKSLKTLTKVSIIMHILEMRKLRIGEKWSSLPKSQLGNKWPNEGLNLIFSSSKSWFKMSNNLIYKVKQYPVWFKIIVLKIVWHISSLDYLMKTCQWPPRKNAPTDIWINFLYSLKVFTDPLKLLGVHEPLKKKSLTFINQ